MSDRGLFKLEGAIENWVADRVADHISTYGGSAFGGTSLRWSDNMPDDDPHADFLLVDSDGIEYTLDVEVFLRVTRLAVAPPVDGDAQLSLLESDT